MMVLSSATGVRVCAVAAALGEVLTMARARISENMSPVGTAAAVRVVFFARARGGGCTKNKPFKRGAEGSHFLARENKWGIADKP